jgi:hypothetical protein
MLTINNPQSAQMTCLEISAISEFENLFLEHYVPFIEELFFKDSSCNGGVAVDIFITSDCIKSYWFPAYSNTHSDRATDRKTSHDGKELYGILYENPILKIESRTRLEKEKSDEEGKFYWLRWREKFPVLDLKTGTLTQIPDLVIGFVLLPGTVHDYRSNTGYFSRPNKIFGISLP